jgi:hypothetical protein
LTSLSVGPDLVPAVVVNVGQGDVADALVVAKVVKLAEVRDSSLMDSGRVVDDQLELSLKSAVVALDLAVGLRVVVS